MMAAERDRVDIDRIVDYRTEYRAAVEKPHITGDNLTGLCPFHDDRNNSFSVNLKNGLWKCHAGCGEGNFIGFWARRYGVDTHEAYKQILERYHVEPPQKKKPKEDKPLEPYSLEQYAFEKRLPADFLAETCRVTTAKDKGGNTYLRIPYINEAGVESTFRKRYGGKKFFWKRGSSGKICLYGEWRIEDLRRVGYAVLVEGESDTHSLWYMGIPALGIAGATMFKPHQAEVLQDLKLYLHQEPDHGGETFISKVTAGLREGGFIGEVYTWQCARIDGSKDPSDLYMEHGQKEAAALIREALRNAQPLDITKEDIPEAISGAPVNLRQPEGWIYSEKGISVIDEKKFTPKRVCRTPIILTQRLIGLETGTEKIEIAFKRDDKWRSAIFPRSTVFQRKSVTALADLGCTVTSENAKQVVQFLEALEAENDEIIPRSDMAGAFGWQPGKRFFPGIDDNIVPDPEFIPPDVASAFSKAGTFEDWTAAMAPHRSRDKFRFILAASFAPTLLRIIRQRNFVVYNWGGSRGGKTAALKAALSAWGDPERLMVNFNATQVGLERMATLYCDIPLGIDERQLAGDDQSAVEKTVYLISNGKGKTRGAKGGGLQSTGIWRTIALCTGEEPAVSDSSQTGVSTRALEIYGGPFDNELDASRMHQQSAENFGHAGPAFVDRVASLPERSITGAFSEMQNYVRSISDGKNNSHVSSVATIALADAMLDSWVFSQKVTPPSTPQESVPEFLNRVGVTTESWERAKQMAATILLDQVQSNAVDVNESAVQYIVDWVLSNKAFFGTNVAGTCLGMTSDSGDTVWIFPSQLREALRRGRFNPQKTMLYLAERGLITTAMESGIKRNAIKKRFGTRTMRVVEFHLGDLAESHDPLDLDDADGLPQQQQYQQEQLQFTELEDDDGEELPF